jgi:hypothetical protein
MKPKALLVIAFAALVASCGGSGGGGGSPSTPTPTPPPPPPPSGELYQKTCEGYDLVSTYHDGEGGFYEETTVDSTECGYIAPSLDVSIDDTYGDRFKPVVVTVDYRVQGEPSSDWTSDVGDKVDGTTLHIYGDGRARDGFVTINDEEYMFQYHEEPRCAATQNSNGAKRDCMGYLYRGDLSGFIYYGEEDTQRVTIEIAIIFNEFSDDRLPAQRDLSIGERQRVDRMIASYQDFFDRSGIHIDVELAGIWFAPLGTLNALELQASTIATDLALGSGVSYSGTCGVAFPNVRFRQGYPPVGLSRCGPDTDIHELGHAVGLAHGPNNSDNQATGYIFPEFGHGANELCGSTYRDLMAYGGQRISFWNSLVTCGEMFPNRTISNPERSAGDRSFGDSAYHWNRIRYDVSLINNEHGPSAQLYEIYVRPRREFISD